MARIPHPGLVLYISFGSQNSINPSQMMELAMGLEQSVVSLLWAIRPSIRFLTRMTVRGHRAADRGNQERSAGTKLGTAAGDSLPRLDRLISAPLWVELCS
ncbi:unnamed protein product [Linum trigynum]|uniref:Uncharacterized protein n=1 Tax=Linum trigynum TaxID=586398 RepID=A0AAV2FNS2_9ROSI